ncbi:hypothetical protein NN561_016064 [Cricetulus griseus]
MFKPHKLSEVKSSLFSGLLPKSSLASADSRLRFSRYLELCPRREWDLQPRDALSERSGARGSSASRAPASQESPILSGEPVAVGSGSQTAGLLGAELSAENAHREAQLPLS